MPCTCERREFDTFLSFNLAIYPNSESKLHRISPPPLIIRHTPLSLDFGASSVAGEPSALLMFEGGRSGGLAVVEFLTEFLSARDITLGKGSIYGTRVTLLLYIIERSAGIHMKSAITSR